jgi:hypothetical protein
MIVLQFGLYICKAKEEEEEEEGVLITPRMGVLGYNYPPGGGGG